MKHSTTQWMHSSSLSMILHYKLETTNDLLSSRAGLLTVAQVMDSLHRCKQVTLDTDATGIVAHIVMMKGREKAIQGQASLNPDSQENAAELSQDGYIYCAIATNRDELSDSEISHWYNQRAEDSENRLKELTLDFGGDALPCSDFQANALYFLITALSYNVFALTHQQACETGVG